VEIFQKIGNPLYKIFNKTKRIFLFLHLIIYNFTSHKKIIASETDAVVTLTSHSNRILRAFAAIESIGLGAVRPRKIILYLGNKYAEKPLPKSLERLKKRGLEVVFCNDVGPHTKYFPYIDSISNFEHPLVTADDDKIYEKNWLERLIQAWKEDPNCVHCFRARKIIVQNGSLLPYKKWPLCTDSHASFANFATGVSGVIYPPELLIKIKNAGLNFLECCPKADDIWLHANAIRNSFKIRQLNPKSKHYFGIPGSSKSALHFSNLSGGENDIQLNKTYNSKDLQIIVNSD
jgi:hypothetical protein